MNHGKRDRSPEGGCEMVTKQAPDIAAALPQLSSGITYQLTTIAAAKATCLLDSEPLSSVPNSERGLLLQKYATAMIEATETPGRVLALAAIPFAAIGGSSAGPVAIAVGSDGALHWFRKVPRGIVLVKFDAGEAIDFDMAGQRAHVSTQRCVQNGTDLGLVQTLPAIADASLAVNPRCPGVVVFAFRRLGLTASAVDPTAVHVVILEATMMTPVRAFTVSNAPGLAGPLVTALIRDEAGDTFWIGNGSGKVTVFDIRNGTPCKTGHRCAVNPVVGFVQLSVSSVAFVDSKGVVGIVDSQTLRAVNGSDSSDLTGSKAAHELHSSISTDFMKVFRTQPRHIAGISAATPPPSMLTGTPGSAAAAKHCSDIAVTFLSGSGHVCCWCFSSKNGKIIGKHSSEVPWPDSSGVPPPALFDSTGTALILPVVSNLTRLVGVLVRGNDSWPVACVPRVSDPCFSVFTIFQHAVSGTQVIRDLVDSVEHRSKYPELGSAPTTAMAAAQKDAAQVLVEAPIAECLIMAASACLQPGGALVRVHSSIKPETVDSTTGSDTGISPPAPRGIAPLTLGKLREVNLGIVSGADVSKVVASAAREASKLVGLNDRRLDTAERVKMETTSGIIVVQLKSSDAPMAIHNFISLARSGFYDNLTFHRVIRGFMVQGGCPKGNGTGGKSVFGAPFPDEFPSSGAKAPEAFDLCMANTGPNTNESQFFITTAPTPWLKGKHTVFGSVTEGRDVVRLIEQTKTGKEDRPFQKISVLGITVE